MTATYNSFATEGDKTKKEWENYKKTVYSRWIHVYPISKFTYSGLWTLDNVSKFEHYKVIYSGTCYLRPALQPTKSSLILQVVLNWRYLKQGNTVKGLERVV